MNYAKTPKPKSLTRDSESISSAFLTRRSRYHNDLCSLASARLQPRVLIWLPRVRRDKLSGSSFYTLEAIV